MARELHDSVSQALYGIALGAQTALGASEAGLADMRALIFELRPESLEREGLVAALHKQAASPRARHAPAVALDVSHESDVALKYKEALYRIVQAALHNIVTRALATPTRVELRLACAGGAVRLEILRRPARLRPD